MKNPEKFQLCEIRYFSAYTALEVKVTWVHRNVKMSARRLMACKNKILQVWLDHQIATNVRFINLTLDVSE